MHNLSEQNYSSLHNCNHIYPSLKLENLQVKDVLHIICSTSNMKIFSFLGQKTGTAVGLHTGKPYDTHWRGSP